MTQEHDAETVERMAAAMWRAETVESGTPESVTLRRTPQMFRDLGETNRTKWIKFARAALSAMPAREVTGWQPIETAPKDGTSVLLYMPHRICEGWFAKGEWSEDTPISPAEYSGEVWVCCDDAFQVEVELGPEGFESHSPITHWMPLPTAPESK